MRTKYLKIKDGQKAGIDRFPSFDKSGSVTGMKRKFYGKEALLVQSGNWIYNVSGKPEIYYQAK